MTAKIATPLLTLALLAAASTPSLAAEQHRQPATIQVSATGEASIIPDMAIIQLSVLREGETARDALDANTVAMAKVMDALLSAGIEERDLQTSNFSIQPRYVYPKRRNNEEEKPPRIVGYTVSNDLTVRIRDLKAVGTILDQSVTLGVNRGGNIRFTSSAPDAAISEARKSAMMKAMEKAKVLVETAGAKLGAIRSISEQNRGVPQPRVMARMADAAMEAKAVPIAAGENTYSVTVNVSWEIEQ